VRRLLSSPRRRRHLAWGAGLLVAGGVAASIAFLYPNTGEQEVFTPGKPKVAHEEPPSTPLPKGDLASAQRTLSKFVVSAILRQHVERSYDLAAASVRGGLTRKEWRTGDIPVPPFPAKAVAVAKSKLVYSHQNLARYDVLLYTKPGAQLMPLLYSIELTRPGRRGRWLVDYAMPLGGGLSTRPTPYRPTAAQHFSDETGKGRLAFSWVLVPLGILSLIVVVPAVLGARGWLSKRRAEREYPSARHLPPLGPPGP
jgi:hypothetical protein